MKIIGILGSPRGRKSRTRSLLVGALAGAEAAGAETELIDVARLEINCCRACNTCYRTGRCVIDDDFHDVYEKMLAADGIVLASPVYFNMVSAQLKMLIDRTTDCRHCQLFAGKYGMSVVTTANSGAKETVAYLNDYLIGQGAFVVGGVSLAISAKDANLEQSLKKAAAMGMDLVAAIREQRKYPEQARAQRKFVRGFKFAIMKHPAEWKAEFDYYKEKGWM